MFMDRRMQYKVSNITFMKSTRQIRASYAEEVIKIVAFMQITGKQEFLVSSVMQNSMLLQNDVGVFGC
jgi:predicted O-linked N-acetylglucosamine transferase (SPINDLY family)